jgi:hypothetical protein
MDQCVDCGEVISICDHAVQRLLDPERSYSLGEVERLNTLVETLSRVLARYQDEEQRDGGAPSLPRMP